LNERLTISLELKKLKISDSKNVLVLMIPLHKPKDLLCHMLTLMKELMENLLVTIVFSITVELNYKKSLL
jgi:hypothetical protein